MINRNSAVCVCVGIYGAYCSVGCYCEGAERPLLQNHHSFSRLFWLESSFHQHLVVCLLLSNSLSSWEFGLSKEKGLSQTLKGWKQTTLKTSLSVALPSAICWQVLGSVCNKRPLAGMLAQSYKARAWWFCNLTWFLSNCKGSSINRLLSYECRWYEICVFVCVHNNILTSCFHISNLKWLYHFIIRKKCRGGGRWKGYFYSGMFLIFRKLEVILYLWKVTFHSIPEKKKIMGLVL